MVCRGGTCQILHRTTVLITPMAVPATITATRSARFPYVHANPANLAPTGTTSRNPIVSPQFRAFRFSQNRKIFVRIHFIGSALFGVFDANAR
jgi:hypothetical protein